MSVLLEPHRPLLGREAALESARSLVPVFAFLLSLLIGAALIAVAGVNPLRAYQTMFDGAFGNLFNFSVTIRYMVPLALTGFAVAIPFRCGLFNIGGDGQLLVGATASTGVAVFVGPMPVVLHAVLALLAGGIAGAAWGALAGVMRATRNANEIITTIMLNFVALYIVQYLTLGPWKDPNAFYSVTKQFPASATLPLLWTGTAFNAGIFVLLTAFLLVLFLVRKSRLGFSMRVVSEGPRVAQHVGIGIGRTIAAAMAVGGFFAGCAGASEVMGVEHSLSADFSPGYGLVAIGVALLGRASPMGVMIASLFFAALQSGTTLMQRVDGVPSSVAIVLSALPVVFVAVSVAGRPLFRPSGK